MSVPHQCVLISRLCPTWVRSDGNRRHAWVTGRVVDDHVVHDSRHSSMALRVPNLSMPLHSARNSQSLVLLKQSFMKSRFSTISFAVRWIRAMNSNWEIVDRLEKNHPDSVCEHSSYEHYSRPPSSVAVERDEQDHLRRPTIPVGRMSPKATRHFRTTARLVDLLARPASRKASWNAWHVANRVSVSARRSLHSVTQPFRNSHVLAV